MACNRRRPLLIASIRRRCCTGDYGRSRPAQRRDARRAGSMNDSLFRQRMVTGCRARRWDTWRRSQGRVYRSDLCGDGHDHRQYRVDVRLGGLGPRCPVSIKRIRYRKWGNLCPSRVVIEIVGGSHGMCVRRIRSTALCLVRGGHGPRATAFTPHLPERLLFISTGLA
jgi:hypothetical protein